jgi:hypothetical protein
MRLKGTENTPGVEEGAKMERWKNDVSESSQPLASVGNREKDRRPVYQRPVGLTITVEKLDRVLADVQAQIVTLELERTNLGLVRGELARMEAMWRNE